MSTYRTYHFTFTLYVDDVDATDEYVRRKVNELTAAMHLVSDTRRGVTVKAEHRDAYSGWAELDLTPTEDDCDEAAEA